MYNDKVIIICPTYERRHFLPILIYQFSYQTYQKDFLQMIILDDSKNSNIDLFENLDDDIKNRIFYIHDNEKKTIGAKRNFLNNMAKELEAKYIVCFDDDDYYPPNKILYAIEQLKKFNYHICGSSVLPIYYTGLNEIYMIGPFNNKLYPGHASNGTLIYDVEFLNNHSYNDYDTKAEEKFFLNNFKIRLLQLPYQHVILCISHNNNTINKTKFINNKKLNININEYINDSYLINFYQNINNYI
jgi:hypothetical protein